MTRINPRLHDQYLTERDASHSTCFPDFPTWLARQHSAIHSQQAEIEDRQQLPEKGARRPLSAFTRWFWVVVLALVLLAPFLFSLFFGR